VTIRSCLIALALLIICAVGVTCAGNADSLLGDISVYSNLTFNREEGDVSGDQILIIPSHGGKKVLWRTADGAYNPPLLLDAAEEGGFLRVVVPSTVGWSGEWTLEIKGRTLVVKGPKGVVLRLKQTKLKE